MSTVVMLTLEEANKRVEQLKKEIEYLEPLLNEQVRKDLEVNVDEAPWSIQKIILKEEKYRRDELTQLQAGLEYHFQHTPLEFKLNGLPKGGDVRTIDTKGESANERIYPDESKYTENHTSVPGAYTHGTSDPLPKETL